MTLFLLLASWVVVTGTDPAPEVAYAAAEFTNAVYRCSGERLAVVAAAPRGAEGVVEIGAKGPNAVDADERLGYRSTEGRLQIVGNQPRAALHATYQYLRRELGVRWLWPGETGAFYPACRDWRPKPGLKYTHVPTIRYRGFHLCGGAHLRQEAYAWLARNCATIHRNGVRKDERKYGFYSYGGVHNASLPQKYFNDHPDWYAEFKGERRAVNICWHSEGAFRQIVENLDREAGDLDILSIFPADNQDYCQCAECAKMSVSDNWFRYFNRLVEELEPRHPGQKYTTLAYQGYMRAPTGVVPKAHFIEFATHGRCNAHLYGECPDNVTVTSRLAAWYKLGVPMGEYTYELDIFSSGGLWLPIFSMVDDDLTHAAGHKHVIQIPETGLSIEPRPLEELGVYRHRFVEHFMMAKNFDAALTLEEWMDDACRTAFGAAGAAVKEYFLAMDDAWRMQSRHPGILLPPLLWVQDVLKPETVAAAEAALAKAEAQADTERARENVSQVRREFAKWQQLLAQRAGDGFTADPDHTLLYFCGSPVHEVNNYPVDRENARRAGWDMVLCTNDTEVMAALPKANNVWFRFANAQKLAPATLKAVQTKMRNGGLWYFSSYWKMDLGSMTGDPSFGAELVPGAGLPMAIDRPTFLRGGAWMSYPWDIASHAYRVRAPCYIYRGTGEGWTPYLKCRAKEGESPFLSTHRYGKGLVVLGGERFGLYWVKVLENLRAAEFAKTHRMRCETVVTCGDTHDGRIDIVVAEKDPKKRPRYIPCVRDVFNAARKTNDTVVCDIGMGGSELAKVFENDRYNVGLESLRVLVASKELSALRDFKNRYPYYETCWLGCGVGEPGFNLDKAIAAAREAGCRVLCPRAEDAMRRLKPADAEKVRSAGLDFRLADVNSPKAMAAAKAFGATAVFTDQRHNAFEWAKRVKCLELVP